MGRWHNTFQLARAIYEDDDCRILACLLFVGKRIVDSHLGVRGNGLDERLCAFETKCETGIYQGSLTMKTVMMFAAILMVGCSSTTTSTTPQVPTQGQETVSPSNKQSQNDHAIIYKTAFVLADGTAFVFDEVEKAWKWIDTDEHKKQLSHAVQVIKSGAEGAYDAARDAYNKK